MKNIKTLLILLSLVSYSTSADTCAALTPEATCTANTACQWTAGKCSGDSGNVCSAKTDSATCKAQTYTVTGEKCKFTAATKGCKVASGEPDCSGGTTEALCGEIDDCEWTEPACSSKPASNDPNTDNSFYMKVSSLFILLFALF